MNFTAACAASFSLAIAFVPGVASTPAGAPAQAVDNAGAQASATGILARDNLVATLVNHFDAKNRNADERAQLIKRLGFTKTAHNWRQSDVPDFDAEIEALQKHGIELLAWMLYGPDNPHTQAILDAFKRHGIHPAFWVYPSGAEQQWLYPSGLDIGANMTAQERRRRVVEETDHVVALRRQAAPYGVKVVLYNHNGWFGMEENQLAIIARLKELGITDVGMVYNFAHSRDAMHDDSKYFAKLWLKMKPHVVEVNITGMPVDGRTLYPSQGDSELDMLRVIERSGWRGRIGVAADKGGDAEVTLRNVLAGVDWLAAELRQDGAGGPRPVLVAAPRPAAAAQAAPGSPGAPGSSPVPPTSSATR